MVLHHRPKEEDGEQEGPQRDGEWCQGAESEKKTLPVFVTFFLGLGFYMWLSCGC